MGVEKRKRRKRRLRRADLQAQLDKELIYQLHVENMTISTALKLEEFRVKRRIHDSYVV